MAQPLNELEHRWGERIRVNIPVQVAAQASGGIDGFLKNVSLSGALMAIDVDLRLHSLIEISIRLPPPCLCDAVVKAHVTRKVHDAVGVEWCEFAPRTVKHLLRSPSVRSTL